MEGMQCSDVKIFEAALGVRSPWFTAGMSFEARPGKRPMRADFEAGKRFSGAGQSGEHPLRGTLTRTGTPLRVLQHVCVLDEGSQGPAAADR